MLSDKLSKQFEALVSSSTVRGCDQFSLDSAALINAVVLEGTPAVRGLAQELVSTVVGEPCEFNIKVSRAQQVLGLLIDKSPDALDAVCDSLRLVLASGTIFAGRAPRLLGPCLYNKPQNNAAVLKAMIQGIQQGCGESPPSHSSLPQENREEMARSLLVSCLSYTSNSDMQAEIKGVPNRVPFLSRILEKLERQACRTSDARSSSAPKF